MHALLRGIDADSVACANLHALARELERGAAALIVTEEALQRRGRRAGAAGWRASRRGRTCRSWS